MSPRLDIVTEEQQRWQPMNREQFRELRRGQRLQDRRGRDWTVVAPPFQQNGRDRVVVRSGDLVRQVPEPFADEYMVMPAEGHEGR
jgi:hypothetical protein